MSNLGEDLYGGQDTPPAQTSGLGADLYGQQGDSQPAPAPAEKSTYDKVTDVVGAPTDIMSHGVAKGYNMISQGLAGGLRAAGEALPGDNLSPPGHTQTNFLTDTADSMAEKTSNIEHSLDTGLQQYKHGPTSSFVVDAASGAAQMPFYIGAAATTGPAGVGMMAGASSFESTYEQAIKAGKTHDEAFKIAGGVGAIQGGLNSIYIGRLMNIASDTAKPVINRVLASTANAAVVNAVGNTAQSVILDQSGVQKQSTYDQVKDILYQTAVGTVAAVAGSAPYIQAHAKLSDLGIKNPDKVLEAVPEIRETMKGAVSDTISKDNDIAKQNPAVVTKTLDAMQAMHSGDFKKVSDIINEHGGMTPEVKTIMDRYENNYKEQPPPGVHYTDIDPESKGFQAAKEVEAEYGYDLKPFPKSETEEKVESAEGEKTKEDTPAAGSDKDVITWRDLPGNENKTAEDQHREIIEQALAGRKRIPKAVLNEYPDLTEKQPVENNNPEMDKAVGDLEQQWANKPGESQPGALSPEHQELEDKLGKPEDMAGLALGKLDTKIEGIFANKDQPGLPKAQDLNEAQFQALEEYAHRVDDAKYELSKDPRRGSIDTSDKDKEPHQMTKEEFADSLRAKQPDYLSQIFRPATLSPDAKAMAAVLREGKGVAARDTAQVVDKLNRYAKMVGGLDEAEQLKLIDYMENRSSGAKISDSALQPIADTYRHIFQSVEKAITEQFPDANMRQDYFTHQYKDPIAAAKFFSEFNAKQGSGKNLRERTFPTLKDAMEAGLEPKTTNPGEVVGSYVANMNNFLVTHRVLEKMVENGQAGYFKAGRQPDGWVPLEGNLAKQPDRAVMIPGSNSGEPVILPGKQLYAPENAARVYNNDISDGFSGPFGDIADKLQHAANFANKLILGGSTYHALTVTFASMASDVARGFSSISHGDFLEGLKDLGSAITPGKNAGIVFGKDGLGTKVANQYLGKEDYGPQFQKIVDLMTRANTVNVKQQNEWKAGPAKDFVDSFKAGTLKSDFQGAVDKITTGRTLKENPLTGSASVIANTLGKTMDTIAKPLFDKYIPNLKLAANFNELHAWLRDHPDSTYEEQTKAARDIGDSVDNRFGEMQRDNLFWHAMTRETLQMSLLSYSWVTGAARMLKGIPDTGKALMTKGGDLSPNAKYLFGMAATYAIANGVMTYLHTGEPPKDIKDLVYYRTGGRTPQGKDERGVIPGHTMQFTQYLHDGLNELGNEANPALKMLMHVVSNSDFRGMNITKSNNSWFGTQRWEDYLKYTLHENEPIILKTFLQGKEKGSNMSVAERALGARAAPEFVTDPEGFKQMMDKKAERDWNQKLRSDKRLKARYESNDDDDDNDSE